MLDSLDTLIAFVVIMLIISLLITIAVQLVAAVLNLRGLNLLYGLRNTFNLITPEIVQNTTDLARSVLKGRLVSDSFLPSWGIFKLWRHATAIRPDEAFDSIHRIAVGKKSPDNESLRQNAQNLLVALGVDRQLLENAANQILKAQQDVKSFSADAKQAVQSISDQKLRAQIETVATSAIAKVGGVGADAVAAADNALSAAATSIDTAYQKFQFWTDICQERVQQWFTTHTRIITVVFAIFFALGLQLDSADIFKLVSSNRAIREKLVAQSSAFMSQAEKTLGDTKSVLQEAYERWFATLDAKTKDALKSITVGRTDTPEQLVARVKAALPSSADKEAVGKSFDDSVKKVVGDKSDDLSRSYSELNKKLADTGFDLVPNDGFGRRWGKNWREGWQAHIWGLLFSVGLLSLGAPFWYNALKNLVSLRSTVAQNISKQQEQDQKKADDGKPKPPPASLVPSPAIKQP
jgi:hypothetical protein